jgi:hypothetical protein
LRAKQFFFCYKPKMKLEEADKAKEEIAAAKQASLRVIIRVP